MLTRSDLSAIVAYKGLGEKELIGNSFPKNILESSLNDLYRKGFRGDASIIFKTDVLRQFLFPEIEGEKFITEDYSYCQIDEKYKMKVLPVILTVCEYRNDGYTRNIVRYIVNNPKGMISYYNLKIGLAKSLKEKVKFIILYTAYGKLSKQKNLFKNCKSKFLYILSLPLSIVYYIKKKKILKSLEK